MSGSGISDPVRLRKEGGSGATPFVYLWRAAWTGSSILSLGFGLVVAAVFGILTVLHATERQRAMLETLGVRA